jgi:hypothetical protein
MNCQRFEELAPRIARQESRDAELLRDASNHAASCAACNALLTEARTVAASLAAIAAHDKVSQLSGHLEASLRAAFLREHANNARAPRATGPAALPSSVFIGAFRWAALSMLAAAIIAAVLLLPRVINHKPETNHATVNPPQAPSLVVTPIKTAPVKVASETPVIAAVTKKRATAPHHPAKTNAAAPEQTLIGFVMLPYADDVSTIHSGTIVRVSMPRSTLGWFGFPVISNNPADRVVADLFMNQSGTPEAIRLVQ